MRRTPACAALALALLGACGDGNARATLVYEVEPPEALEAVRACAAARLEEPGAPARARVRAAGAGRLEVELTAPELDASVQLWVGRRLDRAGELAFALVAEPGDLPGVDLAAERARLERWLGEHPGEPLAAYARVPAQEGGPDARLVWYAGRPQPGRAAADDERRGAEPCLRPSGPRERFTSADVRAPEIARDARGYSSVRFSLGARAADFEAFTARHVGRRLAVVVDGEILTAPAIAEPLRGELVVGAELTEEEARALVAVLRSGPLPARLRLLEVRTEGGGARE